MVCSKSSLNISLRPTKRILPCCLRLLQRGIDVVDEIGVVLGHDAVEIVEVDVIGA